MAAQATLRVSPTSMPVDGTLHRWEAYHSSGMLLHARMHACRDGFLWVPQIMREGKDVTLVAFGKLVGYNLKAAEELAEQGIDAEVGNRRSCVPVTAAILCDRGWHLPAVTGCTVFFSVGHCLEAAVVSKTSRGNLLTVGTGLPVHLLY